MIPQPILSIISKNLQKHNDNVLPFGRINMMFVGDLHQLAPIKAKAVYQLPDKDRHSVES